MEQVGPVAIFFALAVGWTSWISIVESINKEADSAPPGNYKRSLLHDKYSKGKIAPDIDYVIIGSGMGGLSCAAILSRLGRKVLVLEQHNDVCGGGTHVYDLNGYRFDSGLHYTVPWSVPIFALTCLKKPKHVAPFALLGESDGTVDKIYLTPPVEYTINKKVDFCDLVPFKMKYEEAHLSDLYAQFPDEKKAIDAFMKISIDSMNFVKIYLFGRLLPKWLQKLYWKIVPRSITDSAKVTASELLPKLTSNKRLISLLSSMWIDTGARPDKASFMLTASVFRGISMEGGCYPVDGSDALAKELVTTIEVLFCCISILVCA
jgi:all-trans-retinol 13,14-reductase